MDKDERIKLLETKISEQKRQLHWCNEVLERKNKILDSLGYVWCDGGCRGGIFRETFLDIEEKIAIAEKFQKRLDRWIRNAKSDLIRKKSRNTEG